MTAAIKSVGIYWFFYLFYIVLSVVMHAYLDFIANIGEQM